MDKSLLLGRTNALLNMVQRFICVSRPRRFGKSMAMDMMAAYYGRGGDSAFFAGLKIAQEDSFEKYLNKYDVIKLNIQKALFHLNHNHQKINMFLLRISIIILCIQPECSTEQSLL